MLVCHLTCPSKGFSPGYKLVDATRDPAIHEAFRRVLKERLVLDSRIEMAGIEARAYQLHISPLGADLAVGVFFDITELERLEPRPQRVLREPVACSLRTPLTAILAYAETLLDGAIDDPQNNKRFIEKLLQASGPNE